MFPPPSAGMWKCGNVGMLTTYTAKTCPPVVSTRRHNKLSRGEPGLEKAIDFPSTEVGGEAGEAGMNAVCL